MTATFMLQFVMGVSAALGGNVTQDAFGIVAMVAMMPLISIQVMGVIFARRMRAAEDHTGAPMNNDIVELWEVEG